jgi:hypothetical protein
VFLKVAWVLYVCGVLRVNWKHYCNQFREGIIGVVRVIIEAVKLHLVNNSYYMGHISN